MANTSGQGSQAVVPREVKGWNWGAFLLTWIWGIGNHVWLALIILISFATFILTYVVGIMAYEWGISDNVLLALLILSIFAGLITAIVLGIKGSEWAWQNKRWDSIEHFRITQGRWGLWGTGLVVVASSLVAVAITPGVIREYRHSQRHRLPEEAIATERVNIQIAVTAMMAENNLDALPNPTGTATNDMGAFPDATSVAGSPDKAKDPNGNPYHPGDKNGYLLYGHDMTGDSNNTTLVDYMAYRYTKGTYKVDASGEVTQVTTGYE